ncbi:MAG: hypothetical protein AAGE01_08850 [Pseudomonadota bacterium]
MYELQWPIFGVLVCFGVAFLAILGGHLSATRRIRLRAIQAEERMKAIEAGLPLPEVEDSHDLPGESASESYRRQIGWFRMLCLALGLFFAFGGAGMGLAFLFVFDASMQGLAPLGMIPLLSGVGLLLFYWLTRAQTP